VYSISVYCSHCPMSVCSCLVSSCWSVMSCCKTVPTVNPHSIYYCCSKTVMQCKKVKKNFLCMKCLVVMASLFCWHESLVFGGIFKQPTCALFRTHYFSACKFVNIFWTDTVLIISVAEWLRSPPLDQHVDIEDLGSNHGADKLESGFQLSVKLNTNFGWY
jgi:hypothetical protein